MAEIVIDTNVILAANLQHEDLSEDCIEACVKRLEVIKNKKIVVIDDGFRILNEYQNKTKPNGGKGSGDVFVKWLLNNKDNSKRCHQVAITERSQDEFEEFPDKALAAKFDPPDRKFAAVSNGHPNKPTILQAADCKWLDWYADLKKHGIKTDFLCPRDVSSFYAKKFPKKPIPKIT